MKNYIKPTFVLAGLAPMALASAICENPVDDNIKELVLAVTDREYNASMFAVGEQCQEQLDIEGYCKFTLDEYNDFTAIVGS